MTSYLYKQNQFRSVARNLSASKQTRFSQITDLGSLAPRNADCTTFSRGEQKLCTRRTSQVDQGRVIAEGPVSICATRPSWQNRLARAKHTCMPVNGHGGEKDTGYCCIYIYLRFYRELSFSVIAGKEARRHLGEYFTPLTQQDTGVASGIASQFGLTPIQ